MELPLVRADDVLAQPTRARLFTILSELDEPVTTDDLAARLNLHPNGVRNHLARLEHEGVVVRRKLRHGPGRPRDGWVLDRTAHKGVDARGSAYENLARWLARSIEPRPARLREVEDTGVEIGHEQAGEATERGGVECIAKRLGELGFRPRVADAQEDSADVFLDACPYVDAAAENAPVVCALHRGMTRGMVEVLAPASKLADFVPADPARAGCLVALRPARRAAG